MRKLKKVVIILSVSILCVVVFFSMFFPRSIQDKSWPSECGTGFVITFADTSKFDKSEIRKMFEEHFSQLDVRGHAFTDRNWWKYITISDLVDNEIHMGFPGVWQQGDIGYDTIMNVLEHLDGGSSVKTSGAWCY